MIPLNRKQKRVIFAMHPFRFEEAMEELKKTISRDNDRQKRP